MRRSDARNRFCRNENKRPRKSQDPLKYRATAAVSLASGLTVRPPAGQVASPSQPNGDWQFVAESAYIADVRNMFLRNIAAALAALTLLASVETANAGPFGEFFKQLRDSFRNGNEA